MNTLSKEEDRNPIERIRQNLPKSHFHNPFTPQCAVDLLQNHVLGLDEAIKSWQESK
jgi:hypothetical protein